MPFGVGRLEMHSGAATKARGYTCRITCSLHQCHALFEQLQRGARISLVKVVAALIQRLSQDSHRIRFSRGQGTVRARERRSRRIANEVDEYNQNANIANMTRKARSGSS